MSQRPGAIVAVLLALVGCDRAGAQPVWTFAGNLPSAMQGRAAPAMAYDVARGRMVLFSGRTPSGNPADTWERDAAGWSRVSVAGPPGDEGHAMTYDASRARVVMMGGWFTGSSTWEYDGTSWRTVPPAPSNRAFHAMAFDGRVLSFAGQPFNNVLWSYDGATWTNGPSAPASLFARWSPGLAHDSRLAVSVVFGGARDINSGYLNDTWFFDGALWSAGPAAPATLYPRNAMGLAYDASRGRVVLFGGNDYSSGTVYADTWELDATGWVPGGAAPVALLPRGFHAMVYDDARQRVVLVGGTQDGGSTSFLDDVWEYGSGAGFLAWDILAGAGAGSTNPNRVRAFTTGGQPAPLDFLAYGVAAFGAKAVGCDLDGLAHDDVLTGPGPGPSVGSHVRAFDRFGAPNPRVTYFAYGTLRFGVEVAAADLDGDGDDEIVTGAGPGSAYGPHVRGYDLRSTGITALPGSSYYAYASLRYGVDVGSAYLDSDGVAEMLTGPGPGPAFRAHVRGFRYDGRRVTPMANVSFFTGGSAYGIRARGANVDADPFDEIVTAPGAGPSNASRFLGFNFDGVAIGVLPGYDVVPFPTLYGGHPSAVDLDRGSAEELLAAPGADPAAAAVLVAFGYSGVALTPRLTVAAFPGLAYGAHAGSGALGF